MGVDYGAIVFYGFMFARGEGCEVNAQELREIAWDENFDDGIDVIQADHYDPEAKFFIAINDSVVATDGDTQEEINPDMGKAVDWNKLLYEYCEKYKLEYQEPKWYVVGTCW